MRSGSSRSAANLKEQRLFALGQFGMSAMPVVSSRLYSRQMGAESGKKTSQEHRSSALRCLMSFRWEVNHNREQRTPERAVLRKCCAAQQPPEGNRQPSLLCSPSVQSTIAVSTEQAFRSWSSSVREHLF